MHFRCLTIAAAVLMTAACSPKYDVVVVGGTPGGIMTAISASRMGHSAIILERNGTIGGLPANGLGATDIATRGATTGLFLEFVTRVKDHYVKEYGADSKQVRDCSDGYHFEPGVALKVFEEMLGECSNVTVRKMSQFDSSVENIQMEGGKILSIVVTDRVTGKKELIKGKVFIDATYEGDLGAAAGVPFRIGRESQDEFNEPIAGKVYKYWGGPVGEGTTYEADNTIQAYNYRLCLTQDPSNRVPFRKPDNYDREEYVSLIDDILDGNHTGVASMNVTDAMRAANRKAILAGGRTSIPDDRWGIAKVTNMVVLPNGKTDANNQHMAFISTDLPEENQLWPTASWEWRDAFAKRLRDYTEGLLWFAANDEAVPESFRREASTWGYAADEYQDNDNFPRQVYVREGRRFEGMYFFTANDALDTDRGPTHADGITASHYALDSHAHHKREAGRIHLDGFLSWPSKVYNVPYGVMVPKEVTNLLFPVPVSGSHIGFSTLRMEPCWMALGQAAGTAACLAIEGNTTVQDVDITTLQDDLLKQGATLVYMPGHSPSDSDFISLQKEALAACAASGRDYTSQRPDEQDRLFRSEAVEAKIREVNGLLTNPRLAWMFTNCYPNTLDTTVHFGEDDEGNPRTFVYTGDIHAMWLRDSGAQVWPYVQLANQDPHLKEMLAGVINCQFSLIGIDPYANAFNDGPTGTGWQSDRTKMDPNLHERKWEIDSDCYPIRLAYHYWKTTGDTSVFGPKWITAITRILQTFREQQRKEGRGPYSFQRRTTAQLDTKSNSGYGNPVKPVGLIASSFRPSDDATTFEFLIPSNFFAVSSLRKAAEILEEVNHEASLASECRALADEVADALKRHATYKHPKYGTIYAFEVDGFGNRLLMDDANVPSLLAMAYLGDVDLRDKTYQNTRRFVWSEDNPYFFKGKVAEGIGGPHIGYDMIWPMSIMMKAFTSTDDKEIKWCIETLMKTDAGTGFMHESFHKDDASHFTREWFAWQNTLFGELILKLIADGKLPLLNSISIR